MAVLKSIEYITILTKSAGLTFEDLRSETEMLAGCADATRGLFGGGRISGSNTTRIDKITIQTTAESTSFGDLTEGRRGLASGVQG